MQSNNKCYNKTRKNLSENKEKNQKIKKMEIQILVNKVLSEINGCYAETEDFMNWVQVNSVIEFNLSDVAYCIDYSIKGYKKVDSDASEYKKIGDKWTKQEIDKDLKSFLEEVFNKSLVFRFEELEENERDEKMEMERAESDYREMEETYRTLQYQF